MGVTKGDTRSSDYRTFRFSGRQLYMRFGDNVQYSRHGSFQKAGSCNLDPPNIC